MFYKWLCLVCGVNLCIFKRIIYFTFDVESLWCHHTIKSHSNQSWSYWCSRLETTNIHICLRWIGYFKNLFGVLLLTVFDPYTLLAIKYSAMNVHNVGKSIKTLWTHKIDLVGIHEYPQRDVIKFADAIFTIFQFLEYSSIP